MDKKNIPEINVADHVHVYNAEGYCVASIVSAILENYDEDGSIIVHSSFPSPNVPTICNPTPVTYRKRMPESGDFMVKTWHTLSECKNPKRMKMARIIH